MPPFIQVLEHQGQFKNKNNTANLTIQYITISSCCYIENVHYQDVTYTKVLCYRIYSIKTHSDLVSKSPILAKPVYKTHFNGELCNTLLKLKTREKLHDFTIGSNYHNNIVNTCSILFMVHRLVVVINPSQQCAINIASFIEH